jgi:heat shock protein HslJ
MMACPGPASTVESAFNRAFAGTLSYVITSDRLNLTTASHYVLSFEREAAPTLTGRTWNVTGFNNGRQGVVSPIISSPITLSFADGRVSGRTGCNTFNGSYTQQGNTIRIGTIAATRMMCAQDVMAQEREFLKALESAVRWDVQGDRLDMHRADGERALEASPEAAAALTGSWNVTGFNNGRQGVVSPIISSPITLSFADGRVSGRTGCNTFNGSFTQQGNSIKIGTIAVTNMMCAQDVMAQEREFLKALESAVRWDAQGNRLDMHRGDGERALEATPEAAATLTGAWSVAGFNNGRQGVVNPIVSSPITLSFADGRVSGRTGCNAFNGPFTQQGNTIKIGTMVVTNMMCVDAVMAQEREFLKALESAIKWDVQGNRLDMHRADGERALEATPETAATLTGRAWTITGINNGRDAVATPITGTRLMLSFGGGGRVTGSAGCNTYSGSFTQLGDSVRIGSITTTGRRCPGNVMTQERDFLRALRSVARWSIQGDKMEMHRTDGQTALTASSGPVN